jgi:hypothetical protein
MRARQFLLVAILFLTASAARAETIDVSDFQGGLLSTYQTQWSTLAARGVRVRIVGPCVSACTILVGYIPRNNICVMPNAYLGFHGATTDYARDVECLSTGYPPMDQPAWRPHFSNALATGPKHLPLLSQVPTRARAGLT